MARIKPTEEYPQGKALFKAVCEVRGIPADRAELDWSQWEEGFMTKAEWDKAAKLFLTRSKKGA